MEIEFEVPYERPNSFSEVYYDIDPEKANAILKLKREFAIKEYVTIFNPYEPVGIYKEVAYFLPQGFSFVKSAQPGYADVQKYLFAYCAINSDNLKADKLWDTIRWQLKDCLDGWSKEFKLFNPEAKAIFQAIEHSDDIYHGVHDMVIHEEIRDIALDFLQSLAFHKGDKHKAKWFLDYATYRHKYPILEFYKEKYKEVDVLVFDKRLLNDAYNLLLEDIVTDAKYHDYWSTTLTYLDL